MGFWNKLGKIALTAAPYVAAPFTGGASLMATGLANKAVGKWAESDAKKAVAKGLAPSKFDQRLGQVGNIAGMASMFIPGGQLGALGKAGGAASAISKTASAANSAMKGGSILGNVMKGVDIGGKVLGGVAASRGGGQSDYRTPDFNPSYNGRDIPGAMGGRGSAIGRALPGQGGGAMPRGGFRYNENPLNQYDQNNPNLAQSIFQGRQEAIRNQPFRRGYEVNYLGNDDETAYKAQMPPIYPNAQSQRRSMFKPTTDIQAPIQKKKKSRVPMDEEEEMAY